MKSSRFLISSLIFGFSLILSLKAKANFGEVDLLVRESIEAYFNEYGQSVDLQKLTYTSEPRLSGNTLFVSSSVWAEQRLVKPYWGWHECTTQIEVSGPGKYIDKGTDCFFDFD